MGRGIRYADIRTYMLGVRDISFNDRSDAGNRKKEKSYDVFKFTDALQVSQDPA